MPEPTASPSRPASPDSPRALVVVCTYNERENLPVLLPRIRAALPAADVLIVDDDSPDGTGLWVEQTAAVDPHVSLLSRKHERGLGSALRAGILYAIENRYDYLLNLDGDLSHRPSDLPRLLDVASDPAQAVDVVVGSRYVADGKIDGWPLHRKVMSRLVNGFATKVLRLPVKDCSGALRCYRVASLARLELTALRSDGYAMLEELLLALHRSGAKFSEIPITFHERQLGHSKLTPSETLRSVRSLLRMMFRR